MTLTVRVRLTLWYAGALALVLLSFSLAVYGLTRAAMLSAVDRQLDQAVGVLATVITEDPNELVDPHELTEIEEFGLMELFRVSVGDQLLRETAGWRHATLDRALERGSDDAGSAWTSPDGVVFFVKSIDQLVRGREVRIAVALDASTTRASLTSLARVLQLGFHCVLILAAFGGYLLAGRVLAPVTAMASKASEISAEELSDRLPVDNPHDEFGRLAMAFNSTLARLESSFEQLRRFTANASHELRTPLTALRSVGEVGLQEAGSPAEYRDVIGSMLEETQRLTRLVDTLLTLARADSGRARIERVPTDLGELTATVADNLGVLAEEKGQTMTAEVEDSVIALVDPSILRHALINIIDNAVKHTQAGGEIRVSVRSHRRAATITHTDNGPGVPADHRERIFNRFHRVDDGRSSATGGAGLGLAIAKWAVESNGGQIALVSEVGRGTTLRLSFPLTAAADVRDAGPGRPGEEIAPESVTRRSDDPRTDLAEELAP